MADTSVPVDILNPGQVFACLGLLEAADILVGGAEGGFDWQNGPEVRFELSAQGKDNPVEAVLRFLAEAEIHGLVPSGSRVTTKSTHGSLLEVETFPAGEADEKALPVRLRDGAGRRLDLTYWCDGSGRNPFKLFKGQQRTVVIAREMLDAVRRLSSADSARLIANPFGVLTALGGGSFKLDARKWWTAIDAGYSPDDAGHLVEASPVVEILGAVGLEHARPDVLENDNVRYAAWLGKLPPVLARPALAGAYVGAPIRMFQFKLARSGQNRPVTFAEEVT